MYTISKCSFVDSIFQCLEAISIYLTFYAILKCLDIYVISKCLGIFIIALSILPKFLVIYAILLCCNMYMRTCVQSLDDYAMLQCKAVYACLLKKKTTLISLSPDMKVILKFSGL